MNLGALLWVWPSILQAKYDLNRLVPYIWLPSSANYFPSLSSCIPPCCCQHADVYNFQFPAQCMKCMSFSHLCTLQYVCCCGRFHGEILSSALMRYCLAPAPASVSSPSQHSSRTKGQGEATLSCYNCKNLTADSLLPKPSAATKKQGKGT